MSQTKYTQDYVTFVQENLRLDATEEISNQELTDLVQSAVVKYSTDKPRTVTEQYTGTAAYRYTLPASWESGFSTVNAVEYPDGEQVPVYLKLTEWMISDIGDGNGDRIHLMTITPGTSETFTVYYTTQHTLTDTTTTIDDSDFYAVGYLSCMVVCLSMSGRLIRHKDNRMSADGVSFKTKSDEYRNAAKSFYSLYRELMGLPEKGPRAASLIGDIDLPSPTLSYLTHMSQ